jgi:hypothetical protein
MKQLQRPFFRSKPTALWQGLNVNSTLFFQKLWYRAVIKTMKTTSRLAILVLATFNLFAFVAQATDYTYMTNNGKITITKYTGSGGAVTIPSEINGLPVTRIGQEAFYSCTNLTSVTMGNSVTSLGYSTFENCSNLTSVTIPGRVSIIGDSAFYSCTSLSRITIPDSVSSIGNSAFYSCTSLTNAIIGNSVSSLGQYTFAFCSSLTSVTIGKSVTSLGRYSFGNCTSLTNVTIPDSVSLIGNSAFYYCTNLTSVTIPNSVTSLGPYAFAYCSRMTGVYVPGNAPGIGLSVFEGANNATVYYLPGTTGWGLMFGGRPTALWVLSYPVILTTAPSFGVQTNGFSFIISWATNISVVVEDCTNLAIPTWSALSTNTLTGGSSYFSDARWTNYPNRFYRVRSL